MRSHLALVFVLSIGWGGCGGGSNIGTGVIGQAEAEAVCRPDCEHLADCGQTTDVEGCVVECAGDVAGWARADAVHAFFGCTAALPCDANEGECFDVVDPLPIHGEWEAACESSLAACLAPDELDAECDSGGLFKFVAPAIVEDILACLDDADCLARVACIGSVLESVGFR